MNTIILLIDFEGEKELQDQNYLNKRYVGLNEHIKSKTDKQK